MGGPDAVFLDVDNTMYEIETSLEQALRTTHGRFQDELGVPFERFEAAYWAGVHGIERPMDILAQSLDVWRRTCMERALGRLGMNGNVDAFAMARAFDEDRVATLRPFPGAIEAVEQLAAERTVGVITNGPSPLQRQKVDALGLADLLDDDLIIVSGEHPWHKPDARLFRRAADRAGVEPTRCCMVGDSPVHDMPAAAAGFSTVYVNAKALPMPQMEHEPSAVIETPAQLPAVLGGL